MSDEENDAPADAKELLRRAEETGRKLEAMARQQEQFNAQMQLSREAQRSESEERMARTVEAIQALLKKVQDRHKGEDDDDGVGVGVLV